MVKFIKNNPVKLIFLSLLLGFVIYCMATVEPKGYCAGKAFNGKSGVYLTDEEFIFATLKVKSWSDASDGVYTDDGVRTVKPSDEIIKNYMKEYPECCRVFRDEHKDSSDSWFRVRSGLLTRMFGREQVFIVEHRNLVQVKEGTGRGESLAMVSVCGRVYSD